MPSYRELFGNTYMFLQYCRSVRIYVMTMACIFQSWARWSFDKMKKITATTYFYFSCVHVKFTSQTSIPFPTADGNLHTILFYTFDCTIYSPSSRLILMDVYCREVGTGMKPKYKVIKTKSIYQALNHTGGLGIDIEVSSLWQSSYSSESNQSDEMLFELVLIIWHFQIRSFSSSSYWGLLNAIRILHSCKQTMSIVLARQE